MINEFRKILLQVFYGIFSMLPVGNKIVLANISTGKLEGNLRFIYDEIKKSRRNYKTVLLLHKSQNDFKGKLLYLLAMIKGIYHLATCRYFIIDDYYYPVYAVKPKKETRIYQVWHACGAFKKFGYSTVEKTFGADKKFLSKIRIHSNYDKVLVSSNEVKKYYAEGFGISEESIISIGIPRTDLFFDTEKIEKIKTDLYNRYPEIRGKKVILYAPTFRGDSRFDARNEAKLDFNLMKESLGKEYILVLKLHPFVSKGFEVSEELKGFVLDLSEREDINELMLLSDLMITDYSSVVFEYSLLEKPMLFFAYDLEKYKIERDFYYDYNEFIPGPLVKDTREIIDAIHKNQFDLNKIRDFKNKFFDY
ncbi:MAG: CDP-glycerol--glycerophosphate glycerophosphotransferase, partial [Eubacteriaceae bacterium]|nr:CDP-glycerol--glycerophosphate glycerophosphotransferase [Eubacteriaceae bacterium]